VVSEEGKNFQVLVVVLRTMLFAHVNICSFKGSYRSNVFPRYFPFVDAGIEYLNKVNSGLSSINDIYKLHSYGK
jgi:hypothetical protein